MGRNKKETGVSVQDFVRLRDSVVTGLATLQSAVSELSHAYIAHTNSVLSQSPGPGLDLLTLSNPLGHNGTGYQRGATPGARSDAGEPKRKRKKKTVDPNKPKRPLTPYFLFMHSARPIIARDLGSDAKPGEVSLEGTKRWTKMPPEQRQLWKKAYEQNYSQYQEKMVAYRATLDPSAAQLAMEDVAVADAATDLEEPDVDEDGAEDEQASPPASPRTPKRQKTSKDTAPIRNSGRLSKGKATEIPIPPVTGTEVLPPATSSKTTESEIPLPDTASKETGKEKKKKSQEKPRKRSERKSKGAEEGERTRDESDHLKSSLKGDSEKEKRGDKEKRTRKKRKSDAIEEEE